MELCTYLNYLRQAIRIQAIAAGKSVMDDEAYDTFLKDFIIPDEVTFSYVKCTFFYEDGNKENICVKVPYGSNRYLIERDSYFEDNNYFKFNEDDFIIYLYKPIKVQNSKAFEKMASLLATCNYPVMGGGPWEQFAEIVENYYKEMRDRLCDNLKQRFDEHIFAALLSLRAKER